MGRMKILCLAGKIVPRIMTNLNNEHRLIAVV